MIPYPRRVKLVRLLVVLPGMALRNWPWWTYCSAAAVLIFWKIGAVALPAPFPSTTSHTFDVIGAIGLFALISHVPWSFFLHNILGVPEQQSVVAFQAVGTIEDAKNSGLPFVLYLRSFSGEQSASLLTKRYVRPERIVKIRVGNLTDYAVDPGGPREYQSVTMRPVEEYLAKVSNGQVFALVNTGDPTPPSGIKLIAVPPSEWELAARSLIQDAACVVLFHFQSTPGLLREFEMIKEIGAESKTVVLSDKETKARSALPNATILPTGAHGEVPEEALLAAVQAKIGPPSKVPSDSLKAPSKRLR